MSDSRVSLIAKISNAVLTGGRRTTAANLRQLLTDIVNGVSNINDDDNQANGYLGLDSNTLADITKLAALAPTGKFLQDNGTYQPIGGQNGTKDVFTNASGAPLTISHPPSFVIGVFAGNALLIETVDYNISGKIFTFVFPANIAGLTVTIPYMY